MFKAIEKLDRRIRELEPYRYRGAISVSPFRMMPDENGQNGSLPPADFAGEPFAVGDRWNPGPDAYAWLRTTVTLPSGWQGQQIVGLLKLSQYEGWNERGLEQGLEGMLYLNGMLYQGLDCNHQEVLFPPDLAGTTVELMIRMWADMSERDYTLQRAEVAMLHETTDDLYFTARAVLDAIKTLDESHVEHHTLLNALDRAMRHVDWSDPGSDAFYRSLERALTALHENLPAPSGYRPAVTLIGQTHLDVEWLWQLRHTREKAARSFSSAVRLMQRYPEYRFLQTQPVVLAMLREDYPQLFEEIVQQAREGRWEAEGAMWLEPDTNLPNGESLVRHILYGKAFIHSVFGTESRVVWLLDTFGYTAALPQIMKKAGVDYFSSGKMSWFQYNPFPYDLFRWRGLDGTEILVHLTVDPWFEDPTPYFKVSAKVASRVWERYKNKAAYSNPISYFGFGDGGGGPNREALEMGRRLPALPGIPEVKFSRVLDYFEELDAHLRESGAYVHTWEGEIYLEMHRGTYTSQARMKRLNRKAELLYRDAEWAAALAHISRGARYPAHMLEQGWKLVLLKQFHDVLPGSSIPPVYADSEADYAEAFRIGRDVLTQAQEHLLDDAAGAYTIFNSGTWPYSGLLALEGGPEAGTWRDAQGQALNAVRTGAGWLIEVADVPALGCTTVSWSAGDPPPTASPFNVLPDGIETPHYALTWNADGQIARLYDKANQREVLSEGEAGNVLQVFEDKPLHWDAWDIDIFYMEKHEVITDLTAVTVVEQNALRAVVRFEWAYRASTITQDMILYAGSRRIDFETHVEWHEREKLLKVAFPVAVKATEATYDIAFGNLKRPTHWNTSWDYARFEVPAHQWADLSEKGYGVSLLNDCKYGYDIKGHVMRLSLIKSAVNPDGQTINDQGEHVFTYGLLPHSGDWLDGCTAHEAWNLNSPPVVVPGKADSRSLFRVEGGCVMVDAVKLAEDGEGVILRLHEYGGARGPVTIHSDYPVASWQACDLLERPIEDRVASGVIETRLTPYEIKTIRVNFAEA